MKKTYLGLLIASLASHSWASTDSEALVITGHYSPVENQQLTSSTNIISAADIEKSQATSLSDLLKQVPGIWVEDQGGAGGLSVISMRGSESNYTLVLLDGVAVNDPTNSRGGAFNLNAINLDSIARVEIVRGAQSAIYGSDALAGVIHIITLDTEAKTIRLQASIGDNDFYQASFQTTTQLNQMGLGLSLSTGDSGTQVDGSQQQQYEILGKISWKSELHKLQWNYRLFDADSSHYPEQSGGPTFATASNLDTSEIKDQSSALQWDYKITDQWTSLAKASWYQHEEDFYSPGISPYASVPPYGSTTEFTRTELQWINRISPSEQLWFNLGLANKREKGESGGFIDFGFEMPTDFALQRDINSGFVNANIFLTSELLVQASLRQDQVENDEDYNTHQFGISYQFNSDWRWFANTNSGFKLPSFYALGHGLIGNADLKSEEVDAWDTGIEWKTENMSAGLTWFKHEYENLIDFDAENFTNVNRQGVNTSGVEAAFSWQASEQLHLQFHASYIDIDLLHSDSHLLGRPDVTYGAAADYQLNDQWSFRLNYLSVDDRFAASQYTGDSVEETLPQYDKLDAAATWSINQNHRLTLKVANAFGENYQTDIGFPAPKQFWQLKWVANW
jgi:vitamin B12 transporter